MPCRSFSVDSHIVFITHSQLVAATVTAIKREETVHQSIASHAATVTDEQARIIAFLFVVLCVTIVLFLL